MTPTEREPMRLLSVKVEPKTWGCEPALRDALNDLVSNHPSLSFTIDAESGENILHGASELQSPSSWRAALD
jgi:translation elongation factor EF-G